MSTPSEPAPVSAGRLIAAAWREARRAWPALWPLWVLYGVLQALIDAAFVAARPAETPLGGLLPERLASTTAVLMASAVVGAMALPVMLRERDRPGRPERGQAAYMRGYVLVGFGVVVLNELFSAMLPTLTPLVSFGIGAAFLVVVLMALAPWVLWNTSQLPGHAPFTVAAAWRTGWRGGWAYAVAWMACGFAPTVAYWLFIAQFEQFGSLIGLGLASVAGAAALTWELAVGAVFYRQRLGLERREVAEVFD